ncbi:MAG: hypothetical protein ACR2NP_14390 [Pirellulaceae bacterium]
MIGRSQSITRTVVVVVVMVFVACSGRLPAQERGQRPTDEQMWEEYLAELTEQGVEAGLDMNQLDALKQLARLGALIVFDDDQPYVLLRQQRSNVGARSISGEGDEYRRAWQRRVSGNWKGTVSDLQLIGELGASGLDIQNFEFGNEEIAALGKLQGLESLKLLEFSRDIDRRSFESFRDLQQLRTFISVNPRNGDELLEVLGNLPQLEFVSLIHGMVSETGIQHLQDLQNLKTLMLNNVRVTDDAVLAMCDMANLTRVGLTNLEDLTGAGLRDIGNLEQLEGYAITGRMPEARGFRVGADTIRQLGQLRGVRYINLQNSELDDELFAEILASWETDNPQPGGVQRVLWLDGTRITDRSIDLMLESDGLQFDSALVLLPDGVSQETATRLHEAHPGWDIKLREGRGIRFLKISDDNEQD